MVKLSEIRALIDAYIKTNGNQEITGHTMNVLLNEIVRILDERKQDVLVSGENIKTIGGMSLLGEGDIPGYDDREIRNLLNAVVAAVEGQNGKIAEIAGSVQEQDKKLTEKEDKKNKVTKLTEGATDVQYPSAKAVYDLIIWLKERLEEQDYFIEDLYNNTIPKNADDYYPDISVGVADNLAGVDVVDSEINFRRSSGGAISDGVARIEAIKGNSVVWNQVFKPNISAYGSQFVKIEDDGLTMEVINEPSEKFLALYNAYMGIASHKYFLAFDVVSGSYTEGETRMEIFGNVVQPNVPRIIALSEAKKIGVTLREVGCVGMRFRVRAIDLTQMFGTSNEPTTIEEFYARIPMGVDMNAYNEGTIYNMKATGIKSVGVNAWDEQWEKGKFSTTDGTNQATDGTMRMVNKVAVLPNSAYYFKSPVDTWVLFYDKDGKVIEGYSTGINSYQNACNVKNVTFTTPSNAASMRAYFNQYFASVVGYQNDICLNLSNSELNGKYFPHLEASEDLSIVAKYFPQGMSKVKGAYGLVKSDEISHDKASNRWNAYNAIKRYNLGDFTWGRAEYDGGVYVFYTYEQLKDIDYSENGTLLLSPRYNAHAVGAANFINLDMRIFKSSLRLYIRDDAYTNKDDFKASLQGMPLYCVLAEPIVTELDEVDQFKDLDYKVWNDGTEKAIAEGKSAPLAADITYGFNAIGKIKELESLVAALRAKVGI